MTVRMAINGFGRIGRLVLRAAIETGRSDIKVVAINDLAPPETNAHLLRYDSVHGRFPGKVQLEGDQLDCGAGPIKVLAEREIAKLPWRDLKVDVVAECTGIFTKRDASGRHLDAGAKRVLVSAPAEGADPCPDGAAGAGGCAPNTRWSRMRRARPTAWRRSPRSCRTPSASRAAT